MAERMRVTSVIAILADGHPGVVPGPVPERRCSVMDHPVGDESRGGSSSVYPLPAARDSLTASSRHSYLIDRRRRPIAQRLVQACVIEKAEVAAQSRRSSGTSSYPRM